MAAREVQKHLHYLDTFLAQGFKTLQHLDKLRVQLQGTETSGLLGLGPEQAGKLLAACVAETSLLSALYWVVCAASLLGRDMRSPENHESLEQILSLIYSCRRGGSFAPHPHHEPELLSTVSAVQLAVICRRPEILQDGADATRSYILSLQLPDGSFTSRTGSAEEGDCRFVFAALCGLTLLPRLCTQEGGMLEEVLDPTTVADWLLSCQNLDGGFGCRPSGDCESHAGHTFCCLAGLTLLQKASRITHRSRRRLIRWLGSRQCAGGGLNGRPGKPADACYTWWTLASAKLILAAEGSIPATSLADLFDLPALQSFLRQCSSSAGGVAPHPGDDPDPFHTFFGLSGWSLAAHAQDAQSGSATTWLQEMHAALVLPLGLTS
ncbi:Rabggtb [Symbiodinium microadriaticum]|nr:Rabggtb [Symbiodinium sp. KB8]CAE7878988.1 Rabggtb [Symbiodinium microadriaticum]